MADRRPLGAKRPPVVVWVGLAAAQLGLAAPPPTGATGVGAVLPLAPSAPPGRPAAPPGDPLDTARQRWEAGDPAGVVTVLEPWLAAKNGPKGRERAAALLVLGRAHAELGHHNLASQHFYAVRRTGGPLAPYGAWFEAEADLARGRYASAANTCATYKRTWPEGAHVDECTLLMGDAWSAAGNRGAAAGAYQTYLADHPDSPRQEEIQLNIALAYVKSAPAEAAKRLQELAFSHSYPSTDLAVQAELAALAARGIPAAMPTDARSQMRRAGALRRSGRFDEAWALFSELSERSAAEPPVGMSAEEAAEVRAWVSSQEESFAWATRQYDVYVAAQIAKYEAAPSGALAYQIFKTYGRFGEWPKAMEWVRRAEKEHPGTPAFRGAATDVAWGALHAGEYTDAAERWLSLSKRGGGGRTALFYSAFALLQAGDGPGALARFEELSPTGRETSARDCYWRAKAKALVGDAEGAAADQKCAREGDRTGWYGLLLDADRAAKPGADWRERDGRWHGAARPTLTLPKAVQPSARVALVPFASQVPVADDQGVLQPVLLEVGPRKDLSALQWSAVRAPPQAALAAAPQAPSEAGVGFQHVNLGEPGPSLPDGYGACRYYDPRSAGAELSRFAENNKAIWPDLPAAYDLARAGLTTESARLTFAAYEEWLDVTTKGAGEDPKRQAIARLRMSASDWRPYVLCSRDHYHVARTCSGLGAGPEASAAEQRAVQRLGWPIVRADEIWAHAQAFNVDPYVMLGLMRQESTYRNTALSPVGAIGLVQVMPRTGARVAAMLGEQRYSPRDLEDPAVNLRYGIFYFSKLLDRFDGVFPLAVASYNGGPHNVSRWYRPLVGKIDLDALVEQMQYDETRDYVKKVSGNYARYIALYEPEGARVVVPLKPAGDHAEVINF